MDNNELIDQLMHQLRKVEKLESRIKELEERCLKTGIGIPMTNWQGTECIVYDTGLVSKASGSKQHKIRNWVIQDPTKPPDHVDTGRYGLVFHWGLGYLSEYNPDASDPEEQEIVHEWYGPDHDSKSLGIAIRKLFEKGLVVDPALTGESIREQMSVTFPSRK